MTSDNCHAHARVPACCDMTGIVVYCDRIESASLCRDDVLFSDFELGCGLYRIHGTIANLTL
jgi:hypothetical protein